MYEGKMRDIQRERLKHLLTNAILELWKKETGSLSSVLIEGTICITSGAGKTTVLQVANKFGGSIPENEDESYGDARTPRGMYRYTGPMGPTRLGSPTYTEAPRVECNNPQAMQAFLDNLSPASLVSPVTDYSRSSRERSRSPLSAPSSEQPMDTSTKGDNTSESGSDIVTDGNKQATPASTPENNKRSSPICTPDRGTGGMIPGTGYYTCTSPESEDTSCRSDSSPQSLALNLSYTNVKTEKYESPVNFSPTDKIVNRDENHNDPEVEDAMDLTAKVSGGPLSPERRTKDGDLALSPPQSYTAQVRDVIRQRLLASKASMEEDREPEPEPAGETKFKEQSYNGERDKNSPVLISPAFTSINPMHLPPPPLPVGNSQLSPYTRQLTMPILSRGVILNGPLHPIMKHKHANFSPVMRHSPSHEMPPLSPVFNSETSPTMVPFRETSYMETQKGEPTSPPVGDSPIEKDANGEQRVYKCEFCAKTFLFKSKYHEHLPVHTNARPFQCHLCSRTYKYKYDLRVHLRTHMGIPTKSTVCPFCSGKFDTNKLLRLHIKDAHRDKQKVSESDVSHSSDHLTPAL